MNTTLGTTLAKSATAIPHSRIRELAEIALTMDGVLKLYFGESSLPTPDYIKRAAQKAMADGYTFYTSNAGLMSTREALARYYREQQQVELDPAREILMTASGVQALHLALRCVLDPGDEGLVLTPAWPNGASNIAMANARAVEIPHVLRGDRYEIDFSSLEAAVTPKTRVLLYTSPSNPLGWVASVDEQKKLLDFSRKHNLWLMADEVYERLNYTGAQPNTPAPSILKLATRDDAVIVIQSFSKTYCMTGWRLGWIVARADLAARATQLNEFVVSHAPSFSQRAAETALLWGEKPLAEMLLRLRQSRFLSERLGQDARSHRAGAGRRVLPLPENQGPHRFLRFLQAPAAQDAGRVGARRRVRNRWRRTPPSYRFW